MPANLKILGWKSEGLRCPDHDISFQRDGNYVNSVSLVQMPNGTGKTTVLSLLRTALSGSANNDSWSAAKVREFKKRGDGIDYGAFELKLLMNDRPVTIQLLFDFENGRAVYKTTRAHGQKNGFHPPREFQRFLNGNFVNFFIFDGELAKNLLDKSHTKAEKIVDDLFQLSTLMIIKSKIEEYWQTVTQKRTAKELKGFQQRLNKLTALKDRLKLLEEEQADLKDQLDSEKDRLAKKEYAYKEEIKKAEKLNERHIKAEGDVKEKEGNLRESSKSVLDQMADSYSLSERFASALFNFKLSLDRVKLPESAAREFFEELAEESVCICDRPIDEEIKKVILEKSSQYLGSDDVSLLNSVKTSIKEAVGDSTFEPETQLKDKLEELRTVSSDLLFAKNELDEIKIEIAQENPAAKKAQEEIEIIKTNIRDIKRELRKFGSNDTSMNDENTYGIEVLKKRIEDAEEKVSEIADTITMRLKRDKLGLILESAYKSAHDNITKDICSETNTHITELMPFNDLSIECIDSCLKLEGRTGGSTGEQLSIAYAFLSTLFNRSEHRLPFVVDSPAGPIDYEVRPKVGAIIPKLSEQFIAFTISSERERFVDAIEQQSPEPIQYLTIFRKGRSQLEDKIEDRSACTETEDGICVPGKDYFYEFQLDNEEENAV